VSLGCWAFRKGRSLASPLLQYCRLSALREPANNTAHKQALKIPTLSALFSGCTSICSCKLMTTSCFCGFPAAGHSTPSLLVVLWRGG
jgi:hypothetical protein